MGSPSEMARLDGVVGGELVEEEEDGEEERD